MQIHFIDVGQGDGALLISPQGETVLFDNGVKGNCTKPVSYLQQLGVTKIDYHVASHYHAGHILRAVPSQGEVEALRKFTECEAVGSLGRMALDGLIWIGS